MTYPGRLEARYAQTLAPKKGFLTFYLKIFLNIHGEECFVIQFKYLENVLQRNLRTGTARECIFRASGGTRFKNFRQPWWQKWEGGTPGGNRSAQKNSGYVTDMYLKIATEFKSYFNTMRFFIDTFQVQMSCAAFAVSACLY